MIAQDGDLFARKALVTAAPFVREEDGEALLAHSPRIGEEVAILGDQGDDHIAVFDRHGDVTRLHRDCLTLVPPPPTPPAPVTPDVAAHVLWHYRQLGYPPGSFTSALIRAIAGADPGNRLRLARAFPEYVRAVSLAADHLDGIDRLRQVLVTRVPI